jgi:hypothetical protein
VHTKHVCAEQLVLWAVLREVLVMACTAAAGVIRRHPIGEVRRVHMRFIAAVIRSALPEGRTAAGLDQQLMV